MLYNGEEVGDGTGPLCDVAVDPIDGTTLMAKGMPNSIAVIAVSERGTMFDPSRRVLHGEDRGRRRRRPTSSTSRRRSAENIRRVAKAKRRHPEDVTVCILDRPRHQTGPRGPRGRRTHQVHQRRRRRRRDLGRPPGSRMLTSACRRMSSCNNGPSISADGMTIAFVGVRGSTRQIFLAFARRVAGAAGCRHRDHVHRRDCARRPVCRVRHARHADQPRRLRYRDHRTSLGRRGRRVSRGGGGERRGGVQPRKDTRCAIGSGRGAERELATADPRAGEILLQMPGISADDRLVLFTSQRNGPAGLVSRIESVPLSGGPRHVVVDGADQAVFASAGHLVFARGESLFTVAFDSATGEARGEPRRVDGTVAPGTAGGLAAAVSAAGSLLTAPPAVFDGQLVWVSMTGLPRTAAAQPRRYFNPRVSPDGRRIVFAERGTIRRFHLERDTFTRVTSMVDSIISFPVRSPDGQSIYFRSSDGIRRQNSDGSGAPAVLPNTGPTDYPMSFSADRVPSSCSVSTPSRRPIPHDAGRRRTADPHPQDECVRGRCPGAPGWQVDGGPG